MSTLTIASLCTCFKKSSDYFLFGIEDHPADDAMNMESVIRYVSNLSSEQLTHMKSYIDSLLTLKSDGGGR